MSPFPKNDKFISGINLRRALISSQSMMMKHSEYEEEATKMPYLRKGAGQKKYMDRRASMTNT